MDSLSGAPPRREARHLVAMVVMPSHATEAHTRSPVGSAIRVPSEERLTARFGVLGAHVAAADRPLVERILRQLNEQVNEQGPRAARRRDAGGGASHDG